MTQKDDAKQLAFVQSPIILHRGGGWEVDVPRWMRGALPGARRAYLLAGGSPDLACDDGTSLARCTLRVQRIMVVPSDAVIYLMTASLEQPLGSEWARIYLYVASKAVREFNPAALPDDDWVRDAEKPLSRYEQEMLDHLREQIRAAQVKHAARQNAKRARRT